MEQCIQLSCLIFTNECVDKTNEPRGTHVTRDKNTQLQSYFVNIQSIIMISILSFLHPINLLTNGVSLAYLASWPLILQNLGQDALVTQSLVLISLMVICDVARQFALRRVS